MKLKELEGYLQQVEGFSNPKLHLEQYITSGHIASHMLYTMDQTFNDVGEKIVADFGCGCGVLSIGCGMLGAGQVLGLDIDDIALEQCVNNVSEFELDSNVELINCDLSRSQGLIHYLSLRKVVDTVLMNPPFGTKNNKGIDMLFLKHALSVSQGAVYSLHKTSTRNFIAKKADEWGCSFEVLAELKYDLPKTYRFHKKQSLDVYVDFIRFEKIN